jgi:hypothetical protein
MNGTSRMHWSRPTPPSFRLEQNKIHGVQKRQHPGTESSNDPIRRYLILLRVLSVSPKSQFIEPKILKIDHSYSYKD